MEIEEDGKRGASRERLDLAQGYEMDDEFLTIYWGGYPYVISFLDINTPTKMLRWVVHLGRKTWQRMTAQRMAHLVNALNDKFGWGIWP